MIRRSDIRFSQIQAFLERLGFSGTRNKHGWRFEHVPSKTIFVFSPYRRMERVFMPDLFGIRWQLDGRGLLPQQARDESLGKKPKSEPPRHKDTKRLSHGIRAAVSCEVA